MGIQEGQALILVGQFQGLDVEIYRDSGVLYVTVEVYIKMRLQRHTA